MSDTQIRAWVREREHEIVALLRDLIRIDSTTGREGALADHCAAWLGERYVETIRVPCKGRDNVVGVVGSGRDALVIAGHLDTVPADADAWTRDPWEPALEDGRVFGLGSSDLKASIAAAYFAQLYLADRALSGRLVTAFTIEEETTGDGTRELLAWSRETDFLDPARTVAVITEPTGLTELCLGNTGTVFLAIGITGRGGHGSRPASARNPIAKLHEVLGGLDALAATWAEDYPEPGMSPPTITPTAVRAGDPARHNVIPDLAQCVLDIRATRPLYADDFAELRRVVDRWLADFAEDGYALSWRVLHRREGHRLAADHPLVGAALAVLRDEMGLDAQATYTTAGNDAVFFGLAGIPAINKVGPGLTACAHRSDEYVPVENVLLATELYARLALRWFERGS